MRILVLNGPNLDLLGKREPEIYGKRGLKDIMHDLRKHASKMGVQLEDFQSNEEGVLVSRIGSAAGKYDGIIINPAAFTHTSVALHDAIKAVDVPCVEVHLSNIHAREEFRQRSLTAGGCIGQIAGFGPYSYFLGLEAVVDHLQRRKKR